MKNYYLAAIVLLGLLAATMGAAALSGRPIRYSDLPVPLREMLAGQGISSDSFPGFVQTLEKNTAERERAGEAEHLIYFVLQSNRFTRRPRIEPAESAKLFVENLPQQARGAFLEGGLLPAAFLKTIPANAGARMEDFAGHLRKRSSDARMNYFSGYFAGLSKEETLKEMRNAYATAMRFLYRKEFMTASGPSTDRRLQVSSLYQERGHSTDTQVEANFAVWTGLATLRSLDPSLKLNRVLIVGPGLDFAPRTDLIDAFEPQSYQPFAVADALLQLKLAEPERLSILCVDINSRVVQFLNEYGRGERQLRMVSGLRRDLLSSDFAAYFVALGKATGTEAPLTPLPAQLADHFTKSLVVHPGVAAKITAEIVNVITQRYEPPAQFDAAVVTNVFLYFNRTELALALANVHSMLKPGGYLLHNELRPEIEGLGREAGLTAVQARSIRVSAEGAGNPLFDAFVIQKKTP